MNKPLEALDCNFVNLDSATTKQIIAAFCVLEGKLDLELLAMRMRQMVETFPRLQQKPISRFFGYSWQNEEKFDLNHHWSIQNIQSNNFEDLKQAAEKLLSVGFDFTMPPWHFAFIIGQENKALAFLMIHHCLADGLGGYELLNALCDKKSSATARSQNIQHRHPPTKRLNFNAYLKTCFRLLRELFHNKTIGPINGKNSNQRHILTFTLPLPELKAAKANLQCSLNQLFLSLVCSSLARYYTIKNFPTDSVRAIIPVNMRLPVNRYTLGNHLTGVSVKLPLIAQSISKQVQEIKQRWDKIEAQRLYGFYGLMGYINSYLPRYWQIILCRFFAKKTSFICTNIPGPHEKQLLAGAEITATYGLPALMVGHGLGFSMLTYNHQAHLAVVIDPLIIPNEDMLAKCINHAYIELKTFNNG